jgi:TonB family protein
MQKILLVLLLIIITTTAANAQHSVNTLSANKLYKLNQYKSDHELGCSNTLPTSFKNYIREMFKRIEFFSELPLEHSYGKITLSFYISNTGEARNIKILNSSGSHNSDQLAIAAVQKASPFGPFPVDYANLGQTINFTFYLLPAQSQYLVNANVTPSKISKPEAVLNTSNLQQQPLVPLVPVENNFNNLSAGFNQYSTQVTTAPQTNYNIPKNSDTNKISLANTNFNNAYEVLTQGSALKLSRHNNNPMNYQFQPQQGHYFNTIESFLSEQGILSCEYHFKSFPISYWIQPMAAQNELLIREAIADFAFYFPMRETRNRMEADLTIQMADSMYSNQETMGMAGLEYPTLKGNVTLSPSIFTNSYAVIAKLAIKHEITHAFGVIKHSNDRNDIMYPKQVVSQEQAMTGKINNQAKFGRFTYRDLNTLWILYNQWR